MAVYTREISGNPISLSNVPNEPLVSIQFNGYAKQDSSDLYTTPAQVTCLSGDIALSINSSILPLSLGEFEILEGEYIYKSDKSKYYIHKRYGTKIIDANSIMTSNPGLYSKITPITIPKEPNDITYNKYDKSAFLFTHANIKDFDEPDNFEMIGCITSSALKKQYLLGFPHGTSISEAQTKLKGAKLYYLLDKTIEVPIQDTNLISQLDAAYNVALFDDITNKISLSDENAILNVIYYSASDDHQADQLDPDIIVPLNPNEPMYTHTRYSSNPSGNNMTIVKQTNSRFIGTIVTNNAIAPTNPAVYTWKSLQDEEPYEAFREDLYNYLKSTLSENLTQGDLDIIIRLMSYIFGDLTGQGYMLTQETDPDKAEETYLRHLCTVIGYEWNEALTADQQRESIKLFIDIRRRRGTLWSMENLARVFGQDANSFYSSSDLRGVTIKEYNPKCWDNINFYNEDNVQEGYRINVDNGELIADPSCCVTDYVNVSDLGATWTYNRNVGTIFPEYVGAFYNSDKQFISSFQELMIGTLNIPTDQDDTIYVRFTLPTSNKHQFELTRTGAPDKNSLYPGDIMVEVPQFSSILREALDNIRLIGTRVIFAYMLYLGTFKARPEIDCGQELSIFFDPAAHGYDPVIKTLGPREEDILVSTIEDWYITHNVQSAKHNVSSMIYIGHKQPYEKGFIWNIADKTDYKGFLVDDETLHDDHVMYE